MKKILTILLCGVLFLSGCSKETELETNDKLPRNNCHLEPTNDMTSEKSFSCPEMKNIKQNGNNFFITLDGALYEYSDKKYSKTETNCQKVNTNIIFDQIIRNTLISKSGDFYSYYNSNLKKITDEEIEKGRAWYGLDQMEIRLYKINKNIFYLSNIDIEKPDIYGYLDGNNVFEISYDFNNHKAQEKIIHTFNADEYVEKVTNGYITTNYGYYIYGITNKSKCEKYEDIKCEYGLVQVDTKSNCAENVLYISDNLKINNEMIK